MILLFIYIFLLVVLFIYLANKKLNFYLKQKGLMLCISFFLFLIFLFFFYVCIIQAISETTNTNQKIYVFFNTMLFYLLFDFILLAILCYFIGLNTIDFIVEGAQFSNDMIIQNSTTLDMLLVLFLLYLFLSFVLFISFVRTKLLRIYNSKG
jgi:hypothetical protein